MTDGKEKEAEGRQVRARAGVRKELGPVFTTEQATVYRSGGRRYFTKAAALKGYAKAKFRAKHRCECEQADYADRYPGYTCPIHDVYDKVMPRYLRFLRAHSIEPRAVHTVDVMARKVADAAAAWNRSRVLTERLRDARSQFLCERAKEGHTGPHLDSDFNEISEYRAKSDLPCWKNWRESYDDFERDPESSWCASCRTRTLIHQAYRAAMSVRGARRRVLQRFALQASTAGEQTP